MALASVLYREETGQSMNTKVRIIGALWFVSLVNYLDRVAISFAAPAIMVSLSLSHAQFGMVLSSFGVGYALALIPGGLLTDRLGVRPVLVIGPLFWALFTGLTGLVAAVSAFVVVRFCFGVSEGLYSSTLYKAVGDDFKPRERAAALAICMSALAIGPALAGAMVGLLVTTWSWQVMFGFMAIPAVLASLVAYFVFPKGLGTRVKASAGPEPGEPEEPPVAFVELLKRPSLWLASLSNLASDIAQWGFSGWMPTYLAMERHIDIKHAGLLGSIPYGFAFVGLLLGGWLGSTAWLHRRRGEMVAVCYLAAGLSLFFAYQAADITLAVAGLSSTAFFMFGALAPKGAVVIGLAPRQHRGAYVSTYTTAGQIGGASAPVIIGLLVTATGSFAAGFGFMVVALCVAAASMVALSPMLRRHDAASTAAV